MRQDRLKEELARARKKAAVWQARVRNLERQIRERENLEIVQTVRAVTASPEELRDLLRQIRVAPKPAAGAGAVAEGTEEGGADHE